MGLLDLFRRRKPTTHPLLLQKARQREELGLPPPRVIEPRRVGRARGVGIVYDAAGKPKLSADWLKGLSREQRKAVDQDLAARGWRIGSGGEAERV